MRLKKIMAGVLATVVTVGGLFPVAGCGGQKQEEKAFEPQLDTEKKVELQVAGFFGNFEALDQAVNAFQEYYPNVTVNYEQNGDSMLVEYLDNNSYVDIFMTTDENVRYPEETDRYVFDHCLDLTDVGLDTSGIEEGLLESSTINGSLVRIPMAKKLYGMAVNETLLEKEGLKMPTNYAEFLDVLESLKEKGYTPIQGAVAYVYSDLVMSMAMTAIGTDKELAEKLTAKDGSAAAELKPIFEKLETLIENGYTDYEINSTYPEDNYDGAILSFLEGNVPFWICDTEKFSGMKKRESKSETFSEHPFTYTFQYIPLGENGVYEYVEPWYGFSVNKDSDELDYALEFMRFLVQEDQMNELAQVKGVPSLAKNSTDERYTDIRDVSDVENAYIYDGTIESYFEAYIESVSTNFGKGEYSDADEAVRALEEKFAE